MGNFTTNSEAGPLNGDVTVSFYLAGDLPSSRQISELLQAFESSIIWGALRDVLSRREAAEYDSEERRALNAVLGPIEASYRSFLGTKYGPVVNAVMAAESQAHGPWDFELERFWEMGDFPERFWRRFSKQSDFGGELKRPVVIPVPVPVGRRGNTLAEFVDQKKIGGDQFSLEDFSEWIAEAFGLEVVPVTAVRSGSVEFELVLNCATFTALATLQNNPAVKDCLVFGVQVLREWMGKQGRIEKPSGPQLSPQLVKIMAKYDHIEIDQTNDHLKVTMRR